MVQSDMSVSPLAILPKYPGLRSQLLHSWMMDVDRSFENIFFSVLI